MFTSQIRAVMLTRSEIISDLISPHQWADIVRPIGRAGEISREVVFCDRCEEVLISIEAPSADIERAVDEHDRSHR